ncbi:MAG: Ribosome hibernation promotion factor [Cellulomonadaceae bacterium TMED98]|nr:MAG: Ribosome hibernation promotion factor [Cellulomonadaceae bacterium TMED98]
MEVTLHSHDISIPDRFRDYVNEKSDRAIALAEKAMTFQVKVTRENSSRKGPSVDIVELTMIGKGPVIRAEAKNPDKYAAFDEALDHIVRRLRRAKEKRSPHHGLHRSKSMGEMSAESFDDIDVTPASIEVIRKVETGAIPTISEDDLDELERPSSPVVIRKKVFPSQEMSAEEAVDQMELVGHDFFLFHDAETKRPSVVYRRKGWQYGVISLDDDQ